jgi:Domain of unknown function (DUF4345)
MRLLAEIFFYAYTGPLILAGAWGMVGARLDHRVLFGLNLASLQGSAGASLLSQYRFLRAVELGFGAFAVMFHREIFTLWSFNRLFLATMVAGVLARVISRVIDGRPRPIFILFLASEAVGAVVIFQYTRTLLRGY